MSENEREDRESESMADLEVPPEQSDQVRGGVRDDEDEQIHDLEIQR